MPRYWSRPRADQLCPLAGEHPGGSRCRWLLVAALIVTAVVVRLPYVGQPFQTAELQYLTLPWSERPRFSDPVRQLLQVIVDQIWSRSLDEATARLPWMLASLLTIGLVGWLATAATGVVSGLAAALAIALAGSEALAGTVLSSGPWVASFSLGAIAAARARLPSSVIARTSIASVLLLPVVCLTPGGWVPWLAVVCCFVEELCRQGRRQQLVAAGVFLAVTAAFAVFQGSPQRSFWPPWNAGSIVTLKGQWPTWLAPAAWLLVAVGAGVAGRRVGARWLLAWLLGAFALAAWAQRERWIVSEGLLAVTLVPFLVLVGLGAAYVGGLLGSFLRCPKASLAFAVAIVGAVVGGQVLATPGVWKNWRVVARMVSNNLGSRDVLATSLCRSALALYAPELAQRLPLDADVGRALVVFPAAESGWLIAPVEARLHPAWAKVEEWVRTFGVIDLSPDPGTHVLYFRRGGRQVALRRAADFDLPTATLRRGRLLAAMLETAGPLPSVLWKVDQLVLDPEPMGERNEGLVDAVEQLIAFEQFDRAHSLVDRLLASHPKWERALRLKRRLETARLQR